MADMGQATKGTWQRTLGLSLLVPSLLMFVRATGTSQFFEWFWSEQGPLEFSHVLIPLFAVGVGIVTLWTRRNLLPPQEIDLRWLTVAIVGLSLMCFAIAGEEASWGQHLVGWSTPEGWSAVNDQQETNLHNIGTWADQKPRAIVELGVIIFGILWPVWHLLTSQKFDAKWAVLLPPMMVLPVTFCGEAVRLLETVPKLLGVANPSAFPRPSELQEFYFYTFFALCMWTWRQRLLTGLDAAESGEVTIRIPREDEQPERIAA